jgi:hypothetical protein
MFLPSARASRKTLVESSKAIVMIKTGIEEPKPLRRINARINGGIESMTSTMRDKSMSVHGPDTAAMKPRTMPTKNESTVVAAATLIDRRAP